MGSIKDRSGMNLTEAEDIKNRWQEYTEELYKKDLHDPDNHNGVIAHLDRTRHPGMRSQVGVREDHCEQSYWRWWNSNWAISNPERWCCESAALNLPVNLGNTAVATGLEKVSFHSNPKLAKGCSKFSKPGFNSMWTVNFQMGKLDLKKALELETRFPTSVRSSIKQESSRKTSPFA